LGRLFILPYDPSTCSSIRTTEGLFFSVQHNIQRPFPLCLLSPCFLVFSEGVGLKPVSFLGETGQIPFFLQPTAKGTSLLSALLTKRRMPTTLSFPFQASFVRVFFSSRSGTLPPRESIFPFFGGFFRRFHFLDFSQSAFTVVAIHCHFPFPTLSPFFFAK